jgi:hypothetical protein
MLQADSAGPMPTEHQPGAAQQVGHHDTEPVVQQRHDVAKIRVVSRQPCNRITDCRAPS